MTNDEITTLAAALARANGHPNPAAYAADVLADVTQGATPVQPAQPATNE